MYGPRSIISDLGGIPIATKPWNFISYSSTVRKFSFWHVGSLEKIVIELYKMKFAGLEAIWGPTISEMILVDDYAW